MLHLGRADVCYISEGVNNLFHITISDASSCEKYAASDHDFSGWIAVWESCTVLKKLK